EFRGVALLPHSRPGSFSQSGAIRYDPILYQPRFPFRALVQRPSSPRPCLFRLAEFRHGARGGRPLAAANRGYRHRALPVRVRTGDLRGSRLARVFVGNTGAPPIRTFPRICKRPCQAFRAGPDLSLLLLAPRPHGCRRGANRLAARPRWLAALSRYVQASFERRTTPAAFGGGALSVAHRHGNGDCKSPPPPRLAGNGPRFPNPQRERRPCPLGRCDAVAQ